MHNKNLLTPLNAQNSFLHIEKYLKNDFKDEIEAIFILEYFYSTALTNAKFMKSGAWKGYIYEVQEMYPMHMKNKYFCRYSKKNKIIIWCINKKLYVMVKLFALLRSL